MGNSKKFNVVILVQYAIMTALVIVMQLLSNLLSFGTIQFSLSLIPVVLGACLLGPLCGAYLGLVLGAVNFISSFSNVVLLFLFNSSPVLYIITCFGKTILAGLVSGWIFKLLAHTNDLVGTILASIACPIVNTGFFFMMMVTFFNKAIVEVTEQYGLSANTNAAVILITVFITTNFLIELGLNTVLGPIFDRIIRAIRKGSKSNN